MPRKPIPINDDLIMDTSHGRVVVPGPKRAAGRGDANRDLGEKGWAEVPDDRLRTEPDTED